MENVAAALALAAVLLTGVELAAPGTILRFGEPGTWKALVMGAVLCGAATAFGVTGMLRGEGGIEPATWPKPAAADTASDTEPGPQQLSQHAAPAQQAHPSDQSDDQPQQTSNAEYPTIALADLKLDRKRMIGQKVSITGTYNQTSDMNTVSEGPGDASPVFIDIAQVPDEQRQALLACAPGKCSVDVEGVVGPVLSNIGVRALNVTVHP